MTKLFQFLIFTILLISCKGEAKKNIELNKDLLLIQQNPVQNSKNNQDNCFNYITELVRSSNFPFSTWKIPKEKVNLLIDEENKDFIRAKLLIDTNGTGTIGWIEYHFKSEKLLNTSANLEKSKELVYDKKWSTLFNECLHPTFKKDSNQEFSGLVSLYNQSSLIELSNKYSYDFITDEKGFIQVPKELEYVFNLKNLSNFKLAKLPDYGEIKMIMLICYDEAGQSKLYLVSLNSSFSPINKLLLYDNEEEEGKSNITEYEISEKYDIEIKKVQITGEGNNLKEKTLIVNEYSISKTGLFIKK